MAGDSQDNGAKIVQFACRSGLNQQWVLADAPEGNLRLVARHSGRSLDVQGAVSNDGTGLIQWPWSGDANQRFKLAVAKDAPDGGAVAREGRGRGAAVAAKDKGKDKGAGDEEEGRRAEVTGRSPLRPRERARERADLASRGARA